MWNNSFSSLLCVKGGGLPNGMTEGLSYFVIQRLACKPWESRPFCHSVVYILR